MTKDQIEAVARDIAIRVAKNCGSVPNLIFPDIYLGLTELLAAPPAPQAPAEPVALPAPDGYFNKVSPEGSDYDAPYWEESTVRAALAASQPAPVEANRGTLNRNELITAFTSKWSGYQQVEAGDVLDWLMAQPLAAPVEAQAVPEGWKLVPEVTTREMNVAGFNAHRATGLTGEIWRAMLAAAPTPSKGEA